MTSMLFQRKYKLVLASGVTSADVSGIDFGKGRWLEQAIRSEDLPLAEARAKGLIDRTTGTTETGAVITSGDTRDLGSDLAFGSGTKLASIETKGYTIVDLHMKATISYDKNSSGRRASNVIFEVYNLPKEVISSLNQNITLVNFYAGYQSSTGELPLLVTGKTTNTLTKKNGKDTVTTFTVTQALDFKRNSQISFDYKPSSPEYRQLTSGIIMQKFISSFLVYGIPLDYLDYGGKQLYIERLDDYTELPRFNQFTNETIPFPRGFSASGELEPQFDLFCKSIGMSWGIYAGALHVFSPDGVNVPIQLKGSIYDYLFIGEPENSTFEREQYTLTAINIIGDVGQYVDTTYQDKVEEKDKGLSLKVLLDPRLLPNTLVHVNLGTDSEFNGDYIVKSATHQLEYGGKSWYTELELTQYDLVARRASISSEETTDVLFGD